MKKEGFAGDVSFTRGKCKPGVPCRRDEVSVNDADCHVRHWFSMDVVWNRTDGPGDLT